MGSDSFAPNPRPFVARRLLGGTLVLLTCGDDAVAAWVGLSCLSDLAGCFFVFFLLVVLGPLAGVAFSGVALVWDDEGTKTGAVAEMDEVGAASFRLGA